MAPSRITLALVAAMSPGQTIWDGDVKGFGVRYRRGTITYIYKKRVQGQQVWITIGRHGSPWTPETARKKATVLAADAASGINHSELKRAQKAKLTFGEVADKFLDLHAKKIKPSTARAYADLIRLYLKPAFATIKIDALTRDQIARAHTSWSKTPRSANHALAVLSKIMSWSEDHGYVPGSFNPCRRIDKYKENSRERYLKTSEISGLLSVLDELDRTGEETPYVTAAIRLLLLTGARLSEITNLKWDYVDFESATLWLPDSKTGKKAIRLNAQAMAILSAIPRETNNPYVIVGDVAGHHLINLQKPWRRIRKRAGIEDVRIHDLRHSFASIAINAGASLPMVGKLLGHARPETTARYAHLADDPLRQLNDQIGNAISISKRVPTEPEK